MNVEKLSEEVSSLILGKDKHLPSHDDCEGVMLVALSGGADSVALLRALVELGYRVEAAHCNFNLRGAESDDDEAFCKELCASLFVPLHIAHFDTHAYASLHRVSIEMAARDLRYNYFRQLIADLGLVGVCVAHHRDDSVETVLLNMVRGTGLDGLTGMAPQNNDVLRPMLRVSRSNIVTYLAALGQGYRTDSSNLEDDVLRNKVRLNVIPELTRVNSSAVENIERMTLNLANVSKVYYAAIEESKRRVIKEGDGFMHILIPLLMKEVAPDNLLWELLKSKGFSSRQVAQIYENIGCQSGREWQSRSHALLIDRKTIIVEPLAELSPVVMKIPEPGVYHCADIKIRLAQIPVDGDFVVSRSSDCVCLDAAKVAFPLLVRTVRNGDGFIPFGMKGRKLISDFLSDRKMSVFDKRRQLVVVDANDVIVWVVGLRPDNRVAVTQETDVSLVVELCK